ncbi:MAG: hypothetical protein M1834_009498 [Cirrosporium novae-zelandiae]|nr:MAG: hypothetical protein M1834_009498 [Cirrosporium novae-zelandiae]
MGAEFEKTETEVPLRDSKPNGLMNTNLVDIPEVTWWKDPGLRTLYLMMPILFLGSTMQGYDGSLLNGLQSSDQWQSYFNYPNGSELGLLSAIMGFGGFVAFFFSAPMADFLGRRLTVVIGVVILCAGVIIQVVGDVSTGRFMGGRFLMGTGTNLASGSAPLLVVELAHPNHRGILATMYNGLWYLGAIVSSWTVFGTIKYEGEIAWRLPVALQVLMPVILALFVYVFPESPRWLCSKDRPDEAFQILAKYHANGNVDDEFVQKEFYEIQEAIRMEKENSSASWMALLRTPGNRKRTLLVVLTSVFSQCCGNSLVSYYISKILNSVGITTSYDQTLINGCLTIWCFLDAVGCSLLVDKVGRKKLFMGAAVGMLISFSIWTGCSAAYAETGDKGAGSAVIAMIFIFYGASGLAFPGLTVSYCTEIMPYNLRAKGLALSIFVQGLAGIFNVYVNPIGLENIQWKFYFVYIVVLVIFVICVKFLYVETKGTTLEEIARLFDGDGALVPDIESKAAMAEQEEVEHEEHVVSAKVS